MSKDTKIIGRKVYPNGNILNIGPGEYGRVRGIWFACPPGHPELIANLKRHKVMEHPGGTITVSPSIEVSNRTDYFHGHLKHGVWSECK